MFVIMCGFIIGWFLHKLIEKIRMKRYRAKYCGCAPWDTVVSSGGNLCMKCGKFLNGVKR